MSETPSRRPLPNFEGVTNTVRKAEKLARDHPNNYAHFSVVSAIKEALGSVVKEWGNSSGATFVNNHAAQAAVDATVQLVTELQVAVPDIDLEAGQVPRLKSMLEAIKHAQTQANAPAPSPLTTDEDVEMIEEPEAATGSKRGAASSKREAKETALRGAALKSKKAKTTDERVAIAMRPAIIAALALTRSAAVDSDIDRLLMESRNLLAVANYHIEVYTRESDTLRLEVTALERAVKSRA